ncbi:thermonuclease family protein [Brevibacterium aurantiacum]|uniref:thermonuclease family protein n=1 Tax=Brevibacterium aurantiacum TaxID=273384 RepID=UPI000DF1799A|nr:thermonuclease family protein [Brevibacterium aurantiacum]RCS91620.1 thermonuclease family protein [Brevibacterium aurantiacum]
MIRKALCLASVMAVAGCAAGDLLAGPAASEAVGDPSQVELVRVIDGDTIVVDDGGEEQRVRFLGIDTPEISHGGHGDDEPCGQEARMMTEDLIAGGPVELRSDDAQPEQDRYGRTLAYVEVDGKDLSAELLDAGLAEIYHAADDIARFDEYEALYSQAPQPECAQ